MRALQSGIQTYSGRQSLTFDPIVALFCWTNRNIDKTERYQLILNRGIQIREMGSVQVAKFPRVVIFAPPFPIRSSCSSIFLGPDTSRQATSPMEDRQPRSRQLNNHRSKCKLLEAIPIFLVHLSPPITQPVVLPIRSRFSLFRTSFQRCEYIHPVSIFEGVQIEFNTLTLMSPACPTPG